MPLFAFVRALAITLVVLGLVAPGVVPPGAEAQIGVDHIVVRPSEMITGQVESIDDIAVVVAGKRYERSWIDWIAFNGADKYPRPVAEPMRLDVVQLITGENILGRLSGFTRVSLTVDTLPAPRVVTMDQVLGVVFCDPACGVAAGIPIDPQVIASEAQRLAAVTGASGAPVASAPVGLVASDPNAAATALALTPSPTPVTADRCRGDEKMSFAPQEPRAGDELLIAVTSAGRTLYPRLTGTELATFQRERQGQLGWVYEWIVRPTYPGDQEYTFYVDSTIPCLTTKVNVDRQLTTPTPRLPNTPKPTRTGTPDATSVALATYYAASYDATAMAATFWYPATATAYSATATAYAVTVQPNAR